jgi:hypothetical protein
MTNNFEGAQLDPANEDAAAELSGRSGIPPSHSHTVLTTRSNLSLRDSRYLQRQSYNSPHKVPINSSTKDEAFTSIRGLIEEARLLQKQV